MLQNAYFLAKIGADTAENERILPKFCKKKRCAGQVGEDGMQHYGGDLFRDVRRSLSAERGLAESAKLAGSFSVSRSID